MALSKKQKQRIGQRAQNQAGREVRQARRQTRPERRRINRQANREIGNFRRVSNQAARAIEGTSLKGLTGAARRQVAQEISLGAADVRAFVPLEARAIRGEARDELATVRASVPSMSEVAFDRKQELLTAARERESEQKQAQGELKAETAEAYKEGKRLISLVPSDKLGAFHLTRAWANLEGDIGKAEGIGTAAARRAAKRLREQMLRSGVLGPGVLSDAERRQQSPR